MERGRDRFVTIEGRAVALLEWGPPARSTDRRVVLVHGLGSSALEWERFAGPLAERLDATVTAIDLPGYGRSRRLGSRTNMADFERALTRLLERDGPSVVMGHSMGGGIAIRVAAHRPELVRALVLLDPALPGAKVSLRERLAFLREFLPIALPFYGRRYVARRHRRVGPEGIVTEHFNWNVHRVERVDPELRADMVELARDRWGHQREVDTVYTRSARSIAFYAARRLRRDLDEIVCPTLLIHADQDRLIPLSDAQAVAASHPDWDFEVVHDSGHAVQVEMPDHLRDLVASWADDRLKSPAPQAPSV